MAQSLARLHVHLIFSTKNREPWVDQSIEARVWAFLGGVARQNKLKALQIGGTENHVHMLLCVPPTVTVSKAVQLIKGGSSLWIKSEFPGKRGFAWQDGYATFTVSKSIVPEVVEYIQNQREHHRAKTFEEEYVAFLHKHEIEHDQRYVFD